MTRQFKCSICHKTYDYNWYTSLVDEATEELIMICPRDKGVCYKTEDGTTEGIETPEETVPEENEVPEEVIVPEETVENETDYSSMTKKEIVSLLAENGIEADVKLKRDDLIALING